MGNNLRHLRLAKRWTQDAAAEAMGTTRSQYTKLEHGNRRLTSMWIDKAAVAFDVDPAEVVRDSAPQIVGRVGDEGVVAWESGEPPSGLRELGLSVAGHGLGALLAGSILVLRHERRRPELDDDQRTMVVAVSDGRIVVRRTGIMDVDAGTVHCIAAVGEPLLGVRPVWVSPIIAAYFR